MNSNFKKSLCLAILVGAFYLVNCGGDGGPTSPGGGGGSGGQFVAEESFSFDVAVASQTRFRVEGINGSIDVAGSTSANSVMITGVRRLESEESAEDASERLGQLQVRVTEQANVILARTIQPQDTQGRNYIVNYVITVPRNLGVTANNVNGAVSINGINERVAVANVNGALDLMSIVGSATAELVNGEIDARITLPRNGEIELVTVNGAIDLEIPQNTSAQFSANVANGEITISNLTLQGSVTTNRSVRGTLGDGTGVITLTTVNGSIDVTGF